ncbi:hypothetical protein ACD591_13820 [Rufibacter glacialis]|uniref:DUF4138 domain-containing protein n=1 Tax=Rufibacter glacialis TaxID=1259555 RepID=A0A5M8Q7M4_9BACT|nr:hypothetical protein [Rufibacter glacialis]KAA6431071.1 hypothetical protein FOE74_18405 [Rufibacter glacialis]
MKKLATVFIFALGWGGSAWSQSAPGLSAFPSEMRPPKQLGVVKIASSAPLLLLGSFETDYSSLLVDPKEIIPTQIYRDSAILAPLGPKAKNGVIAIELKNKKTLLKLADVLDHFEVPADQRQLRVLVNKQLVNADRFLADLQWIMKIEVITQDKTVPSRLSWDENEQFLNIVTHAKGRQGH